MRNRQSEPRNSPVADIAIGAFLLIVAFLLFQWAHLVTMSTNFFGWLALGLAVFGMTEGIARLAMHEDKAQTIAGVLGIATWVVGFVWTWWGHAIPTPIIVLVTIFTLILGFTGLYTLISKSTREHKARILISILLCFLAIGFFICYIVFTRVLPAWLRIIILFVAANTLRQGLHNMLVQSVEKRHETWFLAVLPDVVTLLALCFLAQFNGLEPCFHVGMAILAVALFRNTSERTIPEIAVEEQSKMADIGIIESPITFFSALKGVHSNISGLLLVQLVALVIFNLPPKLINPSIPATVFQASLALLAIVLSFALLILQQRKPKEGSEGQSKRQYILEGLKGVGIVYIVIAAVAFMCATITPASASALILPDFVKESLTDMLSNGDKAFGLIVLSLYEWTYFAVPQSLAYIYAIISDFVARY